MVVFYELTHTSIWVSWLKPFAIKGLTGLSINRHTNICFQIDRNQYLLSGSGIQTNQTRKPKLVEKRTDTWPMLTSLSRALPSLLIKPPLPCQEHTHMFTYYYCNFLLLKLLAPLQSAKRRTRSTNMSTVPLTSLSLWLSYDVQCLEGYMSDANKLMDASMYPLLCLA